MSTSRRFDVTTAPFNAVGDGVANDEAALSSALAAIARAGGGTLVLPAGKTWLVGCSTPARYAGGTLHRAGAMTSNLVVEGNGSTIRMAPGVTTSRSPIPTALFFANTALSHVTFRDVVFDLDGRNNSVASRNLLQSAIAFSGDGAYCDDLVVERCSFLNGIGSCEVLLSQTNTSAPIGTRITIRDCYFYHTNAYLSVTDHSSISGASNETLVTGCTFEFSAPRADNVGVVWDLQGTNNRFTRNVVRHYYCGPQVGAGYRTATTGCVVAQNVMAVKGVGVNLWREVPAAVAIDGVSIDDNTITLDDTSPIGTVKCGVSLVTSFLIRNVSVTNNRITKVGTATRSYGILAGPSRAGQAHDGIVITGNSLDGVWTGILVTAASGSYGSVIVSRNTIRNVRVAAAETSSLGIQLDAGANRIRQATIRENRMLNSARGRYTHGLWIRGAITTLDVGDNVYQGISSRPYTESSVSATVRSGNFDGHAPARVPGPR